MTKTGKAYLIGAGPGRPDLITVRGLRLIQRADVVLYDRLVPQEILDEAPAQAEMIFVGKGPDKHVKTQTQIIDLLVDRVGLGLQVVRLKGGDPFVFGRGGEEVIALAEAGYPFEIVPGVSSAIAASAYAGIPVTHRGVVTSFAVVTGHEDPTKPASMTDWHALAQIPTLVLLMAIKHIADITEQLLAGGRPAKQPAAIVSWATTNHQRVVHTTLGDLPATVAAHQIQTPAVIIIGDVAALGHKLAWFAPHGEAEGFVSLSDSR